jgi:hypothetical protein
MSQVIYKPILKRMIAISKSIVDAQYSLELNEKNIIYLALAGISQFQPIEVGLKHKVTVADFAYLRGKVCEDSGRIIPIRSEDARSQLEKALILDVQVFFKLTNTTRNRINKLV